MRHTIARREGSIGLGVSREASPLAPITKRYLEISHVQCYCDDEGRRYTDPTWRKDLVEHLRYITDFTLASPLHPGEPPRGVVPLDGDAAFSSVRYVDLPAPKSYVETLKRMPATVAALWRAIGRADIVHSSMAGGLIPLSWIVTPITKLRRRRYVVVVESALWRLPPGARVSTLARLYSRLSEVVNRWCVNSADLVIFTQNEYLRSLLSKRHENGHVIHASWIDEEHILSDEAARKLWRAKASPSVGALKVVYAGRLVAAKGVSVLLNAMKLLGEAVPVELDMIGEGELLEDCEEASRSMKGLARIRMLNPVPYGPEFYQLLRSYHAVVVPSITDEQPRVVYDAYSQAVPPLASDTPGLRDCVRDGETGVLVRPNDPEALACLLTWASGNLDYFETMGIKALKAARSLTHQEMHRIRWALLVEMLRVSN